MLGIREWNVFGVSYGTNLAMTYIRQYPQGIRSVTLDSVEPPEVVAANLFAPIARAGFDSLFQACTEQPQCWPRRPGIEQTFTDLVRQLEAHPVTTRVEPPRGGAPVKVVLDGGRLVNWLINESENTPDYRNVPAMLAELADGDPGPIATEVAARVVGAGIGIIGAGLAFGVGCAEWIAYMKGSILSVGRRAFPAYPDSVLAPALHTTYLRQECRVWNVPTAPAAQRAATPSTIPTLMLSGSFDSTLPASWARESAIRRTTAVSAAARSALPARVSRSPGRTARARPPRRLVAARPRPRAARADCPQVHQPRYQQGARPRARPW